jgi:hypothetical protein
MTSFVRAIAALRAQIWLLCVAVGFIAACSFDDSKNSWFCRKNADCARQGKSYVCDLNAGYCTRSVSSQGGTGQNAKSDAAVREGGSGDAHVKLDAATSDAAIDAGAKGSCKDAGSTQLCFEADQKLVGNGECRAGSQQCEVTPEGTFFGECLGQVKPGTEICNNRDDDCNGMIDDGIVLGTCDSNAPGACRFGTTICDQGIIRCQTTEPAPEVCDNQDNDCDGMIDEGTDELCYPPSTTGCTAPTQSGEAWTCKGVCTPGKRVCEGGKLKDCAGERTPDSSDGCTQAGTTAADDNCNGMIDEDCQCTSTVTQDCYTGPAGTEGHGLCHHGTQMCTAGTGFGDCTGVTMPVPESCANEGADDDCNDVVDDWPNKGDACTDASKQGACRAGTMQCQGGVPACVTPAPAAVEAACDGHDEDCDGATDEDFDLKNNPMHCGSCSTACVAGETCCGGLCVNTQTDDDHCGMCAMAACGTGLKCCDASCKDLQHDEDHCGSCGQTCIAGTETCCSGGCANLQLDNDNCGVCGKACPRGLQCCGGTCTSLQTDNNNCGTCGKACAVLGLGLTCNCTSGMCMGTLNLCH